MSVTVQAHRSQPAAGFYCLVIRVVMVLLALGFSSLGSVHADTVKLNGAEAPDFVLRSLDGENLRLSEFRGQVVLINFWASWCGACRQAMPPLNDIFEKYHQAGLMMLSINLDDELHRAAHMTDSLGIRFPVLFDADKSVAKAFDVENMPMTVLIDREGKVRLLQVGFSTGDERKFVDPLKTLLDE